MQNTDQNSIINWIAELEKIPTGSCACPQFLKPYHLVTIGLAVKRGGWSNFDLPNNLETYATRMKLWQAVKMLSPCYVNERSSNDNFLPVQDFNQNKRDVLHVSNELAKNCY